MLLVPQTATATWRVFLFVFYACSSVCLSFPVVFRLTLFIGSRIPRAISSASFPAGGAESFFFSSFPLFSFDFVSLFCFLSCIECLDRARSRLQYDDVMVFHCLRVLFLLASSPCSLSTGWVCDHLTCIFLALILCDCH